MDKKFLDEFDFGQEDDDFSHRALVFAALAGLLRRDAVPVEDCVRLALKIADELGYSPRIKVLKNGTIKLFRALEARAPRDFRFKQGRRGGISRLLMLNPLARDELRENLTDEKFQLVNRQELHRREREIAALRSPSIAGATSEDVVSTLRKGSDALSKFHVVSLELVGSVARGDAGPDSDVDLLVTFDRPTTSDDYFGLKLYLEELLGRPVDLITAASVKPGWLEKLRHEAIHVA